MHVLERPFGPYSYAWDDSAGHAIYRQVFGPRQSWFAPAARPAPGQYGDATHAPQLTVDAFGRVTAASSVAITGTTPGGSAGGDLAGTYPNPTLAQSDNVLIATQAFSPYRASWVPTQRLFQAAGVAHAPGIVPDPGATAFTHTQRALLDSAAFAVVKGVLLGYTIVVTDESTASTSFVDLTTLDVVGFTLDQAQSVVVEYQAATYNTAVQINSIIVDLDGTQQASSQQDTRVWFSSVPYQSTQILNYTLSSLASGAHTVKIKHKTDGGTAHWLYRCLKIWLVA